MSFSSIFKELDIKSIKQQSLDTTSSEISNILNKESWGMDDFLKLISPAAEKNLEQITRVSHNITKQRFGNTMQIYIPMYLSSYCQNTCTYCGFNSKNIVKRTKLTKEEIQKEASIIKQKGFKQLLILTGEDSKQAGVDYIKEAISQISDDFCSIGLEIMPLETGEYKTLINAGAHYLTVYQETYHPASYRKYHIAGKKANYDFRIDTPDRAGKAGFHIVNIGALLGLYDWRYEAIALAYHIQYLTKKYWKTKFAISTPRIQDNFQNFVPEYQVSDVNLAQFICAFRLVFNDIGITLSTRESESIRNNMIKLGITAISAESHTAPGGYAGTDKEQQFATADNRNMQEIATMLNKQGYEPVMKDWDTAFK